MDSIFFFRVSEEYGYRECNIIFPGSVEDFLARWHEWMQKDDCIYRVAKSPFSQFVCELKDVPEVSGGRVILAWAHVHEQSDTWLEIEGNLIKSWWPL